MLSETRRQIIEKDLWSPFKLFFHPASHSGRAGEGLLLGIRYSKEYHILPYCTKQGSLWAKIQFKGGGLPLIIGTTYIPPSGSPLLSSLSLATRMKEIQKTLGKAKVEGYAFLGGDLNSRVGPLPPMAPGGDPNVNPHGRQLLRAVHKLGVYICTGRVMGDIPAGVSYHGTRRSAATRLDHIIVSPNLIPHLQDSCIDRERSESDHFPLCASLSIPIHPTPCPSSDQGGHPLSQISGANLQGIDMSKH
jgi:exonuclease III